MTHCSTILFELSRHWVQGRRKHLKVGGPGFEGHFSIEKGTQKIFPGNVGDGGGSSQKDFPDIPKHFPDVSHFSQKITKFFRGNNKILPENNRIFQEIPKCKTTNPIINQRAFCSRKKGTFEKLGAWTLPRAPPPSYATDWVEKAKISL